jgi:hypothetical protein
MSGAVPLLPLHTFMAGLNFIFILDCLEPHELIIYHQNSQILLLALDGIGHSVYQSYAYRQVTSTTLHLLCYV